MNRKDLLEAIAKAVAGEGDVQVIAAEIKATEKETNYGPERPLNAEATVLYRAYLEESSPDCERLSELKSEAQMVIARLEHRKEVFMHALKRVQVELKDAEGIKLNDDNFMYQAAFKESVAPCGRESPQWVKDMIAADADGKPPSIN